MTSFGMMRNVQGLPGSVIRIADDPALRRGTFACSINGMIASVASEHSSPITTSGLYWSSKRLAACVAGSGLQFESSNFTSNLYPLTPVLLIASSASSMPCLSCAPKYDPGPDIGSSAPILMLLLSAPTAAEASAANAVAIVPAATRQACSRMTIVLTPRSGPSQANVEVA